MSVDSYKWQVTSDKCFDEITAWKKACNESE